MAKDSPPTWQHYDLERVLREFIYPEPLRKWKEEQTAIDKVFRYFVESYRKGRAEAEAWYKAYEDGDVEYLENNPTSTDVVESLIRIPESVLTLVYAIDIIGIFIHYPFTHPPCHDLNSSNRRATLLPMPA